MAYELALGRTCDAKDVPSCRRLAAFYYELANLSSAAAILYKAKADAAARFASELEDCELHELPDAQCNAGQSWSALVLPVASQQVNYGRKLLDATKSCDAGNATACLTGAELLTYGRGDVKTDASRAVLLLERACLLGKAAGCFGAWRAWTDGRGLQKDFVRAATFKAKGMALLEAQCASGNHDACLMQAMIQIEDAEGRQ